MYSMALWFWSTVLLGGFALAGLASGASVAASEFTALFSRFCDHARRAALELRDRADRVSREPLSHRFDSLLPSNPSHPSSPGVR